MTRELAKCLPLATPPMPADVRSFLLRVTMTFACKTAKAAGEGDVRQWNTNSGHHPVWGKLIRYKANILRSRGTYSSFPLFLIVSGQNVSTVCYPWAGIIQQLKEGSEMFCNWRDSKRSNVIPAEFLRIEQELKSNICMQRKRLCWMMSTAYVLLTEAGFIWSSYRLWRSELLRRIVLPSWRVGRFCLFAFCLFE